MSPEFKDFLQGLLTKNPKNRLSWPFLLDHPFVKEGVKGRTPTNWPHYTISSFSFVYHFTIHIIISVFPNLRLLNAATTFKVISK